MLLALAAGFIIGYVAGLITEHQIEKDYRKDK
jgi:hypothetical protein